MSLEQVFEYSDIKYTRTVVVRDPDGTVFDEEVRRREVEEPGGKIRER